MAFNHSNETPEQRKRRLEADIKAKETLRKRNSGIRCYGAEGFVSRTVQEDGTVKEQYHYGVDGG